jgi:hypothetical protein
LLQNGAFDPARNERQALFLRPPRLLGWLCFSLKYLGFVGEEFPRELFGAATVTLTIMRERAVAVLLPHAVLCGRSTSSR